MNDYWWRRHAARKYPPEPKPAKDPVRAADLAVLDASMDALNALRRASDAKLIAGLTRIVHGRKP